MDHDKLWRTWGEFYNYPKCCVDSFLLQSGAPEYMKDSPFHESGFIPCKTCHELTKSVDYKSANKLLGISVDNSIKQYKVHIKETIGKVNTKRFLDIAENLNFDVLKYLTILEEHV